MDKIFVIGKDPVPQTITIGPSEKLRLFFVALPGCKQTVSSEIRITGEGSELEIEGVYVCSENDRLKIDLDIRHLSGGSTSRQLFKGIVSEEAIAEFSGLIYVAKDAQKTKAFQSCHTILLSDRAQATAQPMLEIYADDVECSHGASSGFLSEDERFYMRSRGIPEDQALYLQKLAFVAPILANLPEELAQKVYDSIS